MISIIIIILAAVVIYVGIAEGQWIVSVVFGGIALLLLLMIAAGHEDDRAYVNFVRYWARGGPDRERRPREKSRREIRGTLIECPGQVVRNSPLYATTAEGMSGRCATQRTRRKAV